MDHADFGEIPSTSALLLSTNEDALKAKGIHFVNSNIAALRGVKTPQEPNRQYPCFHYGCRS